MSSSLSIEKIYKFLKKHYRLIVGSVFALLIVVWGLVHYQYVYLTVNSQVDLTDSKILVDEEALNQVLTNITDREDNLERVLRKTYPDLFTL